jgi:hypothetical protein
VPPLPAAPVGRRNSGSTLILGLFGHLPPLGRNARAALLCVLRATPAEGGRDMDFAIMTWVGNNVRVGSIFGVQDKDKPGQLPRLAGTGHWAEFKTIKGNRFKFAESSINISSKSWR